MDKKVVNDANKELDEQIRKKKEENDAIDKEINKKSENEINLDIIIDEDTTESNIENNNAPEIIETNCLEKGIFYVRKKAKKISYKLLYSFLNFLNSNKKRENKVKWENELNILFNLKLISSDSKGFSFKIDDSMKIDIICKKKIFFYKNENEFSEINVYNFEHILIYVNSLSLKLKEIEFLDSNNKIIPNNEDSFNEIHSFRKVSQTKEVNDKKSDEYYSKIFNDYLDNNYKCYGHQLSLNIKKYSHQEPENFQYINSEERIELHDKLTEFIKSRRSFLPLTGVSGIGKTITLLEFLRVNFVNYQHCYFNIKYLTKKSNIEEIANEIVKLFNEKQFLKNYIELAQRIENTINVSIWDKIIMILDYVIEMNNQYNKEQKIIIVFDQYKLLYDFNQTLFNIIQEDKYKSHIKFIICSSINEKDVKSNITYSVINKKFILKNILGYEYVSNLCTVKKKLKIKK